MADRDIHFRCDVCGRFVSFSDLGDRKAVHRMLTPDSDRSREEFETLCRAHAREETK